MRRIIPIMFFLILSMTLCGCLGKTNIPEKLELETQDPILCTIEAVEGIEEEALKAFLIGESTSLEINSPASFTLGLGGQHTLERIDFDWEIQPFSLTIDDTDYLGQQSYQRLLEETSVIEEQKRYSFEGVNSAYLVFRINADASEKKAVLRKLTIYGKPNYPDYLDKESEIVMDGTDESNPLSPWRIPIEENIYQLAGDVLNGQENLSAHQKVVNFMEFMRDYRVGLNDSVPITVAKDKIGSCGSYVNLFVALCAAENIPSRMITMANYPKNSGHVVAEVYAEGKWGVYDPTYNMYFTTTPEDQVSPNVLSLEELRNGRGDDADVTQILGFPERVTSDMAESFISADIYVKADPIGVFGVDKPMIYPLSMNIEEDSCITQDEFTTAYQGINYIGAAGINNSHKWIISGLQPEKRYNFCLKVSGIGGDIQQEEFILKAEITDGTLIGEKNLIFSGANPETFNQVISFEPERDTVSLLLTHDYLGPEYHYINLSSISVK